MKGLPVRQGFQAAVCSVAVARGATKRGAQLRGQLVLPALCHAPFPLCSVRTHERMPSTAGSAIASYPSLTADAATLGPLASRPSTAGWRPAHLQCSSPPERAHDARETRAPVPLVSFAPVAPSHAVIGLRGEVGSTPCRCSASPPPPSVPRCDTWVALDWGPGCVAALGWAGQHGEAEEGSLLCRPSWS